MRWRFSEGLAPSVNLCGSIPIQTARLSPRTPRGQDGRHNTRCHGPLAHETFSLPIAATSLRFQIPGVHAFHPNKRINLQPKWITDFEKSETIAIYKINVYILPGIANRKENNFMDRQSSPLRPVRCHPGADGSFVIGMSRGAPVSRRFRNVPATGAAWYAAGGTGSSRGVRESQYPVPNKEVPMSKGTARRARLQFGPENHQPTTIHHQPRLPGANAPSTCRAGDRSWWDGNSRSRNSSLLRCGR